MEDLAFWLLQSKIDVEVAAYLLAGEPVPRERMHSLNLTSYPPKVAAIITLIGQEYGAAVRQPYPKRGQIGRRVSLEVTQAEFQSLAKRLGVALDSAPAPLVCETWPWGSYETKSLRLLSQAAHRFWLLYDPSDPSSAPTNAQVSQWLQEQGVSANLAQAMASILRADNLPAGPRK